MLLVVCVTAVVVMAAIIFGVCALAGVGGRSYEETIDQYVNSLWSADLDSYLDTLPDGAMDVIMSEEGFDREDLEISLKNTQDDFPVTGPGHEPIIEITEIKNGSESDLKQVQKIYRKQLDLDVSEVKSCTVNVSFENSSESMPSMEDAILVKIGNSWYVDPGFVQYFSDMTD